ncbi:MAG: enoyl-CoA hydratase-related protein [Phenylobacterium sp.]|nr:enoyl-CoA hydratase-related protein [Phenylobacterium sp.]MDP3173054.1 enoyl-CoA hydratase-related protein [Phenylobacterium sp.]
MNRPDVMNPLHSPAHVERHEAFDPFAPDPDQWVGIVTGAGERAFSAGNDLKHQAMGGDMKSPPSGFAGLTSRFDLTKPLIAAVNGVAMGGGFEIALACDIILASENALFALPEPRVGLMAGAGGVHRLPRMIGLQRAMSMILTARRVGPDEAKDLGFVSEVTSAADLMPRARAWAQMICEGSPLAVRASKQAVMMGLDEDTVAQAMTKQRTYPAFVALAQSQDYIEGPLAFSQKRKPAWTGR